MIEKQQPIGIETTVKSDIDAIDSILYSISNKLSRPGRLFKVFHNKF